MSIKTSESDTVTNLNGEQNELDERHAIKIIPSRILDLNLENVEQKNLEAQIIVLNSSFGEVCKIVRKFKLENFPNALILSVNCNEQKEKVIALKNEIVRNILKRIVNFHAFLLIVNSDIIRINKDKKISQLSFNGKIIDDSKFNTEYFLKVQKHVQFKEWNFGEFLKNERTLNKVFNAAIVAKDEISLRLLNLFDFTNEEKFEIFDLILKSGKFGNFLAFLNVYDVENTPFERIEDFLKIQCIEESENPFLLSVKYGNGEIVNFLLQFSKKAENFFSFNILKKAIDFSLEKKCLNIYENIKNVEFESKNELIEKYEKLLERIDKLHIDIERDNLENVKTFTEDYPNEKLCYGRKKICPLEYAIVCKKFQIFSYLRAKNFYTDQGEKLEEQIDNLVHYEKETIRVHNLKYVQEIEDAYIGVLLSKCKFDATSKVLSSDVREMLIELSKEKEILEPLLKLASEIEGLKIIFDFSTESVKNADPTAGKNCMGLSYIYKNIAYIGRNSGKHKQYGVFMHELAHIIFNLIYENAVLPYRKGDIKREQEWDKILKLEEAKHQSKVEDGDTISDEFEPISWVFECYDKYLHKAELAVTIFHIVGCCVEKQNIINLLEANHHELFNYVKHNILPDLKIKNILSLISINNNYGIIKELDTPKFQLKELNNQIIIKEEGFIKEYPMRRMLFLTSNVPMLAHLNLYREIQENLQNKIDLKVKNIFIDLVGHKYLEHKLKQILECAEIDRLIVNIGKISNESANTQINQYFKLLPNSKILIICEPDNEVTAFLHLDFSFEDLSENSKKQFLQQKLTFQENQIEISKVIDSVSPENFPVFCSKEKIMVNCSKKFNDVESFPRKIWGNVKGEVKKCDNEQFIATTRNFEIILVSNSPGSGKSVFLRDLQKEYLNQFPHHWINVIAFKDIEDFFEHKDLSGNFSKTIIEFLNLTAIECEVFTKKFKKGEVKILLDGFDETSPLCRNKMLKILELFHEENILRSKEINKNQIMITTREYLEEYLKKQLEKIFQCAINVFKLEILAKRDKVAFIQKYLNNIDTNKIQTEIEKISKFYDKNIIGTPLFLKCLVKAFSTASEDSLKFNKIHEIYIDECMNISTKKFPKTPKVLIKKTPSLTEVHQFYAISLYFDEDFAYNLGLLNDINEWSENDIIKFGILCNQNLQKLTFTHQYHAEYFVAKTVFNICKIIKVPTNYHYELIAKINDEKMFETSRIFLTEMFDEFREYSYKFKMDSKFFDGLKMSSLKSYFKKFVIEEVFHDKAIVSSVNTQDVVKKEKEQIKQVCTDNKLQNTIKKPTYAEIVKFSIQPSRNYYRCKQIELPTCSTQSHGTQTSYKDLENIRKEHSVCEKPELNEFIIKLIASDDLISNEAKRRLKKYKSMNTGKY